MGSGLLNISVTGLNAAQTGLLTTSHNISNASTPGYSRQIISQTTNFAMFTGAGYIGQGTSVDNVRRVYDSFLNTQVLGARTTAAQLESYANQIGQIDNLLGDSSAGLSPAMQSYFNALSVVTANPASLAARQSVVSAAQSLTGRFQTLNDQMMEMRAGVNAQIRSSVGNINSLAIQIAAINQQIVEAPRGSSQQEPNDLLDQRDQLIADLSKEIRVTTLTETDGSLSVFFGTGQPLVIGTRNSQLSILPDLEDPSNVQIGLGTTSTGGSPIPESLINGGKLGGLLNFRRETLDSAQNSLGRIALALATRMNEQHRLGQDLDGNLGGDLFTPIALNTVPASANAGGATLAATLSDLNTLTDSDYRLELTAANTFSLTRLSDNQVTSGSGASQAAALADVLANAGAQGFSLSLTGAMSVGDTFLIRPTRSAASDISLAIVDPRQLALGAPVRTGAASGNAGTATISAGVVTSSAGLPLASNYSLQYQAPGTLQGFPNGNVTVTLPNGTATTYAITSLADTIPYTSDAEIAFNGISFSITGQPLAGDTFTVGPNPAGVADSRNAVLLGNLQTESMMLNGSASLQGAYAKLVADVGDRSREINVRHEAQQKLVQQGEDAIQSNAGVNLDEEAANLMRYQQAYQASAKIISIADKLFDQLLQLG